MTLLILGTLVSSSGATKVAFALTAVAWPTAGTSARAAVDPQSEISSASASTKVK